ncbi:AraC family transcriptional regulator [Sulfitobacter sp. D35]|uniref:helix-turn-helix domain-containing protein n=1 Tax=Sulfitobacter sp. D35 TaxID=3083252 RepID=UPI00296E3D60|nr:AraC family transcriptional regulator [Sulfitobacter sp. D35]MDW4497866.1 AraC family transcriptional regulator [Sulfitobacter sp. D35]
MNTPAETAAIRATESILSGRDWLEFADKLEPKPVVLRPEADIGCACFTVGTHVSEIAESDVAALVLSTAAAGDLHADVDGAGMDTAIRSGGVTFIPPGYAQKFDFRGQTTNTVLSIKGPLFERVTRMSPQLGGPGNLEPRLGFVHPALHRLIEEYYAVMAAGDSGWRVLSESLALRIAYELLTLFHGEASRKLEATPISATEIDCLIGFIDAELENNFDLSDLAPVLDRDPFGFSRSFKAATGESPHQYVIQRRLMKVKELLQHTDDRLVDITYATGFANQAHMTTTFSKHFGMPPGAWRRTAKS